MNIDSLRYIVETSRIGSVNLAAKSLFISHQGLNKSIATIEKEVGSKLFERNLSGVTLTHEGEIFNEFAKRVITDYDKTMLAMSELRHQTLADGSRHTLYATPLILHAFDEYLNNFIDMANTPMKTVTIDESLQMHKRATSDEIFLVEMSRQKLGCLDDEESRFTSLLRTRLGIICKADFPGFNGLRSVSTTSVKDMPLAFVRNDVADVFYRSVFHENLFEQSALQSPFSSTIFRRALVGDVLCLYDSYSYYLEIHNLSSSDLDDGWGDIEFIPFEEDSADVFIGFLDNVSVAPSASCDILRKSLTRVFMNGNAAYLRQYPLNVA